MRHLLCLLIACLAGLASLAQAQDARIVDIPTRDGVSQRLLLHTVPQPRGSVLLFPGGHGGLQLFPNGSMRWGDGNFLVRTRQLFAEQGFTVALVDAPSDLQRPPFLARMRQSSEHVADIRAAIAWLRANGQGPVWLVGTSRGTQSVAHAATELQGADAPDGIVLTATILRDDETRPVPAMALERIRVPVLVVHHARDGCRLCPPEAAPELVAALVNAPRRALIQVQGGIDQGRPCEAAGHHGFRGVEGEVVQQIAGWLQPR